MSTSSTGELLALAERMRGYVQARGGPAKDDDGKYIGTCWPMILEAADVLDRLAATPKAGVDREVIAFAFLQGFHGDLRMAEILRENNGIAWSGTLDGIDAILALLPSVLGGVDQPRSASEPLGLEAMRVALEFIRDGYANQDVNHVDFRVKAYEVALDALDRATLQLPEVEIQGDQT